MYEIVSPVIDAPVRVSAAPPSGSNPAVMLSLHREVLETIRLTIASCAHPDCLSCHELGAVLDRYLLA